NSAGSLNLALANGYSGTYTLNGGLLSLTALNQGSGSAAFNFGGGTFQAATSFLTSVPITLTTAGSNGVFVTGGTLELADSAALLAGSSLTVGEDAEAIFGYAVPGGAHSVPEPNTLALVLAAIWSAGIYYR